MSLTESQLAARRLCLGASEIAAIVGEDPYKDPFSLWAEKTGKVPILDAGEAAAWGNILEPVIAKCAGDALGKRVVKSTGTFAHPSLDFVRANLDYFVDQCKRGNAPVECKSTCLSDGWGEEGTGEVPSRVYIQVMMQMRCSDSAFAHVARLFHSFNHPKFSMYTVAFSKSTADMLDDAAGIFWDNHVIKDVPPEASALSLPALSRLRRDSKCVEVAPEIVQGYVDARRIAKESEEAADEAKAKLLHALGAGDAAEAAGHRIKYAEIRREGFDHTRFAQENPSVASQFTKSTSYRRLDVRAIKEKKE